MANKKLIIGNWKMNPVGWKEANEILSKISKIPSFKKVDIVVAPPLAFLQLAQKNYKKIIFGAQDAFYENDGAYTGKVSAKMIAGLGARYVILGHSEMRCSGETDEIINKKMKAVLKSGLSPVLCVGEDERDEAGTFHKNVKIQIEKAFEGVFRSFLPRIIIAYEPVWAIGKDAKREAKPEECFEMSIYIRKVLADIYGAKDAVNVKLIYGGSVDPKNAGYFLLNGGVEGLLVGRHSLDSKKFEMIIKEAERVAGIK